MGIGRASAILACAAVALSPCMAQETPETIDDTLLKAPPPGAIVLFGGSDASGWVKLADDPGPITVRDGAMVIGGGSLMSKERFQDCELHIEFWLPYMPEATGQGRANSGVYLQGSYEVQVLDSYNIPPESHECGGIYGVSAARVNACKKPEQWQTYDIIFRAPRFDAAGNKTANARITVWQNRTLIQDDVEIPDVLGGAIERDIKQPGPIMLQDHGNPVRYRNIWFVPLDG